MLCLRKYIYIKQFALVKFLIQQVSNFNLLAGRCCSDWLCLSSKVCSIHFFSNFLLCDCLTYLMVKNHGLTDWILPLIKLIFELWKGRRRTCSCFHSSVSQGVKEKPTVSAAGGGAVSNQKETCQDTIHEVLELGRQENRLNWRNAQVFQSSWGN